MKQLHRRRHYFDVGSIVGMEVGGQQCDGGPKPLARGLVHVAEHLRQKGEPVPGQLLQSFLDPGEALVYRFVYGCGLQQCCRRRSPREARGLLFDYRIVKFGE